MNNIIELRNITKQYPGSGRKANNNITLGLQTGEILCIAGENGAGKSTLMKILCGIEQPDCGDIYINGRKEDISSPIKAKNFKIGMVHQHFKLFPEYTVAENIVMGMEPLKYGIFFDKQKAADIADRIISENNFPVKSASKVKELTVGGMQQVEICRILHRNANIIILDEPTSILTEQEVQSLFNTLKSLVCRGKSVILITHKLKEIKQISSRVAVLRRGELAGVFNVNEVDESEIAGIMIGKEKTSEINLNFPHPSASFADSKPVIEFDGVTVRKPGQKRPLLDNVSFSVHAGEILGFAGVAGNGLGVIEAVLGGFLHPVSGKIFHRGKDISCFSTRALRKNGLAYVPADRIRVGSAGDATIEENIMIGSWLKNKKKAREFSRHLVNSFNIEAPVLGEKASALSGGNLQKLILAREINWFKDYIVFSEPTWGLDIASGNFIMKEIDALRRKGAAVILISTNLDEILSLADRIIVMYSGRIAGEFSNNYNESLKEKIGNCMLSPELMVESADR